MIRTHIVQDIVNIWCVAARKLFIVVDNQVKIWSCTLSYKKCHLTPLCLQNHFGTILTIFAKFKYYFDFDELEITLEPSRNEELCPFPILIEKYRVHQLLFGKGNLKAVEGLFMFSLPQIDLLLFYLMERRASATYNILQTNSVVFGSCFEKY